MEKWNLYNRKGILTDKTHIRGQSIPTGYYHLVIHIWLRDEQGRFLIQQRARSLADFPGVWATTGGSAIVGESSIEAVQRETFEELDLQILPENLQLVKRLWRSHYFVDVWLAEIHSTQMDGFQPTSEVDAIDFRHPTDIADMITDGSFYPYQEGYFEALNIGI